MKELNEQSLASKAAPMTGRQGRTGNDSALQDVLASGGKSAGLPGAPTRAKRKHGQPAKRRGRLDREVLAKLGKGLKDCFADVQNQEVPERFKILLQQF